MLAWRSIRSLSDPRVFRGWLYSIAHTALLQSARREARAKRGSNHEMGAVADGQPEPGDVAGRRERRVEAILSALAVDAAGISAAADHAVSRRGGLPGRSGGNWRSQTARCGGLLNRGMAMLRHEKVKRTDLE